MKRIFLFFLLLSVSFLGYSQTKPKETATKLSYGKLERIVAFKSKYITARNVDIWLPNNYNKNKKYAVLYMHDGQMLFDSTDTWNKQEWGVDEVLGALLKEDKVRETIVVGIWNTPTRHADYFPQKPYYLLSKEYRNYLESAKRDGSTKLFKTNVQSDNYLKFIVKELKPFIDDTYATLSDKKHTFIMGSSMGGLISLYAICEYPEIFGGAACLSTHWIGGFDLFNNKIPQAFQNYLANKLPDSKTHKIYFDYGTATLDAFYEPHQLKVDSIMRSHNYTISNWKTLKFEGANHSEKAWAKRIHIPLTFLLE